MSRAISDDVMAHGFLWSSQSQHAQHYIVILQISYVASKFLSVVDLIGLKVNKIKFNVQFICSIYLNLKLIAVRKPNFAVEVNVSATISAISFMIQ